MSSYTMLPEAFQERVWELGVGVEALLGVMKSWRHEVIGCWVFMVDEKK